MTEPTKTLGQVERKAHVDFVGMALFMIGCLLMVAAIFNTTVERSSRITAVVLASGFIYISISLLVIRAVEIAVEEKRGP